MVDHVNSVRMFLAKIARYNASTNQLMLVVVNGYLCFPVLVVCSFHGFSNVLTLSMKYDH